MNPNCSSNRVSTVSYTHLTDAIVLADDSGLEIDYLNKEPGVYSARYMGEDTSYDKKNNNLIERLDGVPKDKRTARFVCAIAAVLPDGKELVTRQTMEGYIGWEIAGANEMCIRDSSKPLPLTEYEMLLD